MSIIKHVTLQKIVAHDFWYDPRNMDGLGYQVSVYTNCHYAAFNTYALYLEDPKFEFGVEDKGKP